MAQRLLCRKRRTCRLDTWVGKIPRRGKMATHSSILAWKVPWIAEPGRLQSKGSQKVRHNWATEHGAHIKEHGAHIKYVFYIYNRYAIIYVYIKTSKFHSRHWYFGTSLVEICLPKQRRGAGLIPGQEAKISHALGPKNHNVNNRSDIVKNSIKT